MTFETSLASAALGSVRLIGLFAVAPIFAHPAVPARVRVSLSMVVAAALGSAFTPPIAELELVPLMNLALGELLIGLVLGFATRMVFSGFGIMGELVSIQGGLGAATTVDPTSQSSSLALASLLQLLATMVFLSMDGHHATLRTIALSLEHFPMGSELATTGRLWEVVAMGSTVFEIALRLAAPLTAAMFLANLAVGLLGRIMPQLNLITVQLPALVMLNLALLMLGASVFVASTSQVLDGWLESVAFLAVSGN